MKRLNVHVVVLLLLRVHVVVIVLLHIHVQVVGDVQVHVHVVVVVEILKFSCKNTICRPEKYLSSSFTILLTSLKASGHFWDLPV